MFFSKNASILTGFPIGIFRCTHTSLPLCIVRPVFLFQQRNIAIAYMAGDVATCSYPQLLLKARTRVDYIHNHVQAAALSPMATLLVLIIMGKEKDP